MRWPPSFSKAWFIAAAIGLTMVFRTALLAAPPVAIPSLVWPGLTQDDIDRMHAAAARLYEGRSIGSVERWRSPSSGDAGEVTLVRSFDAAGMPCRTIDYKVRHAAMTTQLRLYVVTWCRVQEGDWKIVEIPPPH
jgi:surface antigen